MCVCMLMSPSMLNIIEIAGHAVGSNYNVIAFFFTQQLAVWVQARVVGET